MRTILAQGGQSEIILWTNISLSDELQLLDTYFRTCLECFMGTEVGSSVSETCLGCFYLPAWSGPLIGAPH